MASIIPEHLARLTATAFVRDDELAAVGGEHHLRAAAKGMAERALHKLLKDCIRTERDDYGGMLSTILKLDVYLVTPNELEKLCAEARIEGQRDAVRDWYLRRS